MAPFVLLCSAILVLLGGGIAAGAADDLFLERRPQMIFQFGDSLSDTGNAVTAFPLDVTMHSIDRPPYGSTFFHHATGRNSDGRLIIDFLAEGLEVPLLEPSLRSRSQNGVRYAHGANFATCGAPALSLDFYRMRNLSVCCPTLALDTQFQFFVEFKKRYALKQDVASRSVFIVGEIGGNDYEIMLGNGLSYAQMHEYVPFVVQAIAEHIRRLYSEGARQFIVVNVPLQGCSAGHLALARADEKRDRLGCLAGLNSVNSHHNLRLHAEVRRLRVELAGASIFYADFAAVYTSILRNASEYGFDYPFKACCGTYTNASMTTVHCGETKASDKDEHNFIVGEACVDPQRYIYWNDGHFTEHFYYTVANAFMFSDLYVHPPISSWFKRRLQRSSA